MCDILITELFLNFQFSWILIRCVNAIAKPQLMMNDCNAITSLSASQPTFGRDIQQHHILWIPDDFTQEEIYATHTRQ